MKVLIVSDRDGRRRVRRRRARSRRLADEPPGRTWSSEARPPNSRTATRRDAGDLRLRLPAQRRPARRRGLGRLNGYVHEGGGLVVGPGNRCDPDELQRRDRRPAPAGAARAIAAPSPETTFGKVADVTHPLFQQYGKDLDTQLAQVPVYRYWGVKARPARRGGPHAPELTPTGRRRCSSGRSRARRRAGSCSGPPRCSTTPDRTGRRRLERVPESQGWSFLVLMNLTVPYMAGTVERAAQLRGRRDRVLLRLEPTRPLQELHADRPGPGRQADRDSRPPSSREYARGRRAAAAAGPVDGQGDGRRRPAEHAWASASTRPTPRASSTVLQKPDLDTIFGKDGYVLAEDAASLQGRRGDRAVRARDLPLADVPDPDRGDARESPGQHVLQGGAAAERGRSGRLTARPVTPAGRAAPHVRWEGTMIPEFSVSVSPIVPWPVLIARDRRR